MCILIILVCAMDIDLYIEVSRATKLIDKFAARVSEDSIIESREATNKERLYRPPSLPHS